MLCWGRGWEKVMQPQNNIPRQESRAALEKETCNLSLAVGDSGTSFFLSLSLPFPLFILIIYWGSSAQLSPPGAMEEQELLVVAGHTLVALSCLWWQVP